MNVEDAFARAALYQTCKKSRILGNINFQDTDIPTLRALVNKYNANSFREFPIILAKLATKFMLQFVVDRKPSIRKYFDPENIAVRVEDDELAYLNSTTSSIQPNIYAIVVKNLAISLFGTSLRELQALVSKTTEEHQKQLFTQPIINENNAVVETVTLDKIEICSVSKDISAPQSPPSFTKNFLSDDEDVRSNRSRVLAHNESRPLHKPPDLVPNKIINRTNSVLAASAFVPIPNNAKPSSNTSSSSMDGISDGEYDNIRSVSSVTSLSNSPLSVRAQTEKETVTAASTTAVAAATPTPPPPPSPPTMVMRQSSLSTGLPLRTISPPQPLPVAVAAPSPPLPSYRSPARQLNDNNKVYDESKLAQNMVDDFIDTTIMENGMKMYARQQEKQQQQQQRVKEPNAVTALMNNFAKPTNGTVEEEEEEEDSLPQELMLPSLDRPVTEADKNIYRNISTDDFLSMIETTLVPSLPPQQQQYQQQIKSNGLPPPTTTTVTHGRANSVAFSDDLENDEVFGMSDEDDGEVSITMNARRSSDLPVKYHNGSYQSDGSSRTTTSVTRSDYEPSELVKKLRERNKRELAAGNTLKSPESVRQFQYSDEDADDDISYGILKSNGKRKRHMSMTGINLTNVAKKLKQLQRNEKDIDKDKYTEDGPIISHIEDDDEVGIE